MKNININLKTFFITLLLSGIFLNGCESYLNQLPQDSLTESAYFETPGQFVNAANYFYRVLGFDDGDAGSDLSNNTGSADYARGVTSISSTDGTWNSEYSNLRKVNQLIDKAALYPGAQSEIAVPLGTAYFFRAWHHFNLLKRFGGVPIVTKALDVTSEEVYGKRNSRYEVVSQIISDLDMAIGLGLPSDANISTSDKGHLSIEAAKAFKARVLLFEATWEKYVGTLTDGDGTTEGAGSAKPASYPTITVMLTNAKQAALDVMNSPAFELWDHRADIVPGGSIDFNHLYYLFNLEDAGSNPAGLTKADNKEFIFYTVYDYVIKKIGANLTHAKGHTPSRKLMDMYLCTDGLPVQHSAVFQGYSTMLSEFQNRDLRLTAFVAEPLKEYWGWGSATDGGGAQYSKTFATSGFTYDYRYVPGLTGPGVFRNNGYQGRKFITQYSLRETREESYNFPQIRLAEVMLTYAEAACELGNGTISDADLNLSINKIRARSGVAPLTNALIAPYSDLTMLGEIRRERAIELFGENQRFTDLLRWHIAEAELNNDVCVCYITGTEYETAMNPKDPTKHIYDGTVWQYGLTTAEQSISSYSGFATVKAGALILDAKSVRNFDLKNYLSSIPTDEIGLNPNLLQNPDW